MALPPEGWLPTPIGNPVEVRLLPVPRVDRHSDAAMVGPIIGGQIEIDHVSLLEGSGTVAAAQGPDGFSVALTRFGVNDLVFVDSLDVLDISGLEVLPTGEPCTFQMDVYETDRTTIEYSFGTAASHPAPYLIDPTLYAEQQLDIAAGAATLGTVDVGLVDVATIPGDQDSGAITAILGALRRGDIAGRRCRVLRFGSTGEASVIADGPAGTPRLDDSYVAYRWNVRDTRETERKIVIGSDASRRTMIPYGVDGGFGWNPDDSSWLIDPTQSIRWFINDGTTVVSGPHVGREIRFSTDAGVTTDVQIPRAAWDAWAKGFASNSTAMPKGRIRVSVGTDPDVEIKFIATRGDLVDGSLPPTPVPFVEFTDFFVATGFAVISAITLWNVDATLTLNEPSEPGGRSTGRIILFGGEADLEDLPLLVDGLTAGEFAKRVYDGEFSPPNALGEVVSSGVRYDPFALLDMTEPVMLYLDEEIDDAREWLESNIYAPTGWVPALDRYGRISPIRQALPSPLGVLPAITSADVEPSPAWDAGETIINQIEFTYQRLFIPSVPTTGQDVDGIVVRDVSIEFVDVESVARNGEQGIELDGLAFGSVGNAAGEALLAGTVAEQGFVLADARRNALLPRYTHGAPTLNLTVLRSVSQSLRAGDWVSLDLSWLPDYVTGRRGLTSVAQIVSLGDLDCQWRQMMVELLDVPPE